MLIKSYQLMNVDQADWKSWDPRWWADQRQRKDLWVFQYQLKINFKRFSGGQMLWMPSPPTADVDIMPAAAKLAIWRKPKRQVFIQNCFRPQKSCHGFHHHLSGSFKSNLWRKMTNMRHGLLVNWGRPPSASSIKSMPPKILKFDILNFQQTSAFASFYFPAKLSSICSAPTNKQTNK